MDYENPHGGSNSDSNRYLVTVTVDDGGDGARRDRLRQRVSDYSRRDGHQRGTPAAPFTHLRWCRGGTTTRPIRMNESTTSLKVVWHPPENMGRNDHHTATTWSTRRAPTTSFTDAIRTVERQTSGTTTNHHVHGAGTLTRPMTCMCEPETVDLSSNEGPLVVRGDRLDQQGRATGPPKFKR